MGYLHKISWRGTFSRCLDRISSKLFFSDLPCFTLTPLLSLLSPLESNLVMPRAFRHCPTQSLLLAFVALVMAPSDIGDMHTRVAPPLWNGIHFMTAFRVKKSTDPPVTCCIFVFLYIFHVCIFFDILYVLMLSGHGWRLVFWHQKVWQHSRIHAHSRHVTQDRFWRQPKRTSTPYLRP